MIGHGQQPHGWQIPAPIRSATLLPTRSIIPVGELFDLGDPPLHLKAVSGQPLLSMGCRIRLGKILFFPSGFCSANFWLDFCRTNGGEDRSNAARSVTPAEAGTIEASHSLFAGEARHMTEIQVDLSDADHLLAPLLVPLLTTPVASRRPACCVWGEVHRVGAGRGEGAAE